MNHHRARKFFPKYLLPLLLLVLLSACAHRGLSGALQLNTRITDDGLKQFEVVFPRYNQPMQLPEGGDHSRNSRQRPPDLSNRRMQGYLDAFMKESGYCREGHVLLGRYAGETTGRLRGECKERATAEDRQLYPNTIRQW